MATRVTDGARRPRFARLAASPLPRACIALTKSEGKERLRAVYLSSVYMTIYETSLVFLPQLGC